jgi:hypothetical protein
MKCRKCDYPLWNLREPRCPECGERFDVLSYWFEPGTVAFKCPYCDHRHIGTDLRGMPFDAGRCHGCGQMLVVEQMPVEPIDGKYDVATKTDEDFTLARFGKSKGQKQARLVAFFAVGVFILLLMLWLFLRNL